MDQDDLKQAKINRNRLGSIDTEECRSENAESRGKLKEGTCRIASNEERERGKGHTQVRNAGRDER